MVGIRLGRVWAEGGAPGQRLSPLTAISPTHPILSLPVCPCMSVLASLQGQLHHGL